MRPIKCVKQNSLVWCDSKLEALFHYKPWESILARSAT